MALIDLWPSGLGRGCSWRGPRDLEEVFPHPQPFLTTYLTTGVLALAASGEVKVWVPRWTALLFRPQSTEEHSMSYPQPTYPRSPREASPQLQPSPLYLPLLELWPQLLLERTSQSHIRGYQKKSPVCTRKKSEDLTRDPTCTNWRKRDLLKLSPTCTPWRKRGVRPMQVNIQQPKEQYGNTWTLWSYKRETWTS